MSVDDQSASPPSNGSNGHTYSDSAAKRRADELTKKLGVDLWAKYPRELMEFRMDRPPAEPDPKNVVAWEKWNDEIRGWRPIHTPKVRVYSTYMRYSWCWPICLEYAVVTDDRDEILRDHKGRPFVLTPERVAEMLGLSQQRVNTVNLDLAADKLVRFSVVPGRQHQFAGFIEAKPLLTKEERRYKSTVVATGVEGPRLEPAVLRRFSTLLKQLGHDDHLLTLSKAECESLNLQTSNGDGHVLRAGDYRTLVWKQILDNRSVFLSTLKTARYSERKAYSDHATRVRNLIDQRESPDTGRSSAAAAFSAPGHSAAAAGPSNDAPEVRQPPTHGQNDHEQRSGFGGYGSSPPPDPQSGTRSQAWLDQQRDHDAIAEEVLTATDIAPILESFKPVGGITDSRARRLLRDCGGAAPAEIAAKTAELVPGIMRNKTVISAIAVLIGSDMKPGELLKFFHSPAALAMWRREREELAVQEAAQIDRAMEALRHSEEQEARQRDADRRTDAQIAAMGPEAFERLVRQQLLAVKRDYPSYTETAWRALAERAARRMLAEGNAEGAS